MIDLPNILSARGDDGGGWVGFLFFLVPFILWAIGTLAQKMNQKQAEERSRRLREMMEQPPGTIPLPRREPPPPPMRPTRVGPMPAPPPRRPAPARPRVQRPTPPPLPIPAPPRRKPKAPPARPVAARCDEEVILLPETSVPASQQARSIGSDDITTQRPRSAPKAQAIHQWLSPRTLRQQFILTELFQPPLALRPPRESEF